MSTHRNKSRSLSFTPQKINPKSIKDLTTELETLKPLEDVGSVRTGIAKIFHSRTAAVQEIRPTHNKRDLVKRKGSCGAEGAVNGEKRELPEWEGIFASSTSE